MHKNIQRLKIDGFRCKSLQCFQTLTKMFKSEATIVNVNSLAEEIEVQQHRQDMQVFDFKMDKKLIAQALRIQRMKLERRVRWSMHRLRRAL